MERAGLIKTRYEGLKLSNVGKVRDIYDLGSHLLIVATDRISAFDVVMQEPIPDKGKILTKMSAFWFKKVEDIVGNHLVSTDPEDYPAQCAPTGRSLREGACSLRRPPLFPWNALSAAI